ncbi:hypothetical protein K2Z84_13620 [Candidatus Binatia bacterium]|nr:hypothetical protein [Candidatus Binatia bacterium]
MRIGITNIGGMAALATLVMGIHAAPAAATAQLDLTDGVLTYAAFTGTANRVSVGVSDGTYIVDDPAESSILLSAGAAAAGCAAFDNNTVTCPAAAITSLKVLPNDLTDVVDLSRSGVPAVVDGGISDDQITGTPFADVFLWNPGGATDTIDGGDGVDQLLFNGSNANETMTILPAGDGFELLRDIANVHMVVDRVEELQLSTLGGTDLVRTAPLVATTQTLADGDDGVFTDRVEIDAGGLCVTRTGDVFSIEARQPIGLVRFTDVLVQNSLCIDDPCATAAPTAGCTVNGVKNQLCQGSDGNDVIVGTKARDVIKAGRGNDRVRALDGDDVVCGEEGDDVLSGGSGDDRLFGGDGKDVLKGDAGHDLLAGQRDGDSLSGGGGDDEVHGGSGDDRVRGLGGNDVLRGGAGIDRIDGGPGLDSCSDVEAQPPFPRCEVP